MSHVLHVTCHTCYMSQISTNKKFTKDPMCHIFLESSCKIQFNGYHKNVACHIFYMSHATNVTCHKSQVANNFPMTQCVVYFWKAYEKYSLMVMIKMFHVTCVTCHMSHMLYLKISTYKQFYQRSNVLYIFGKLMQNTVQWSW